MKMGECALFTLPPSDKFDGAVESAIPPNSVVMFEVELSSWISVKNVTKDGGVVKRILVRGDGGSCLSDLDEVTGILWKPLFFDQSFSLFSFL